jgi:hypothetical protein
MGNVGAHLRPCSLLRLLLYYTRWMNAFEAALLARGVANMTGLLYLPASVYYFPATDLLLHCASFDCGPPALKAAPRRADVSACMFVCSVCCCFKPGG